MINERVGMANAQNLTIVAGASMAGNGVAIAKQLINSGRNIVALCDQLETEALDQFQAQFGDKCQIVSVDFGSRESLASVVSDLGDSSIEAIVYAQFYFFMENPASFDFDEWDRSIVVNLTAPNYLVRSLQKNLVDSSSIVTVTSTEAFMGSFGASAYAATKAAIHNLTKSWANTLGRGNVRANAVAAGWIGGVMDTDEVFNKSRDITPLGRLGGANEVAEVVEFLLSPRSSFISGTTVTVDGGYSGVDVISKFEFESSKND
ncbi:SDR family oxidoreductase [Amycolatopsis sp. NPDC024027]|uniref:SDR family NAD(P)-dependent oxidoreductase n=1 Tax=Amycolatopsis sp. NPDC024027 TaxID=3154327 RepID=UPI0033E3BE51